MKTEQEPAALPNDFAKHAADITGLDTPPATLEEWMTAIAEQYSEADLTVGFEDLYSETPTRHEVQVNGRIRYTHCALDALQAAVMEDQSPVTVRSVDPVSATPVTFTISNGSVDVTPEEALICFGSSLEADDVEAVGSLAEWSVQDNKSEIRENVCQYTNAFESEETFEQWDAETESMAAPLPPANVVSLAQKIPQENS